MYPAASHHASSATHSLAAFIVHACLNHIHKFCTCAQERYCSSLFHGYASTQLQKASGNQLGGQETVHLSRSAVCTAQEHQQILHSRYTNVDIHIVKSMTNLVKGVCPGVHGMQAQAGLQGVGQQGGGKVGWG